MIKSRRSRIDRKVWKLRQPASACEGPVTSRNASSTAASSPSRACSRTKTYWSTAPPSPYFITRCLPRYTIRFIWENRMPTREDAWKLLCEYTASESLRKHMLAVEACVRADARKAGADEETWSLAALLHDFGSEDWPNQAHCPRQ